MNAETVLKTMIDYFTGDPKRVNHLLKVYGFAKTIGTCEHISQDEQTLVEIAALTHDIGIRICEEKYGGSSGKQQEEEGPGEAEKLLSALGFDSAFIQKVCYLIAHHHTYSDINSVPYQILVEADFIVNIFEDNMNTDSVKCVREKIFRTKTGREILDRLYLSSDMTTSC